MAIMGFGMLAIVGVQGTLRFNGDVSKQRGEATRLAERELERLRGFSLVASGTADESEFDEIDSVTPEVHTPPDVNATFTLKRTIMPAPDGSSKMVHVLVEWFDRTGQKREVSMHDMIARVDPVLSGLVKAGKPLTPIGRRNQRHPTIPERAHNLGDGATSIFKPVESGTVAWVFNNSTGQITHTCTVSAAATSASLTSTAGCTATKGQLLAGEIRFNLRGGANNLGAESAFKPVASGDVAWVIDHGLQRLVRICPVSAGAATASLTVASVATGCTPAAAAISPFAPDDDGHVLTASDSENPLWPSIPATVKLDTSVPLSAGMTTSDMTCYSNARTSSLAPATTLPVQHVTEYFCIITAPDGWSARTVVDPIAFSDGNAAVWSIGAVAGTYKVCRYTTAADGYTTNEDHPAVYGKDSATCGLLNCRRVTGNLINQNFLIIDGTKNCPTDGPADPASGDLVNSKTLQHQP